jgi:hypothetical protein
MPAGKSATVVDVRLQLLGTAGCHLCDDANALLCQAALARRISVEKVDIAGQDKLLADYASRIPVLRTATGAELGWPFGLLDILRLIDAVRAS